MDVEDLALNGRQSGWVLFDGSKCYIHWSLFCSVCPYFLSRKMAKSADLIFMPYNYIIDQKVRVHMSARGCTRVYMCVHVCRAYIFNHLHILAISVATKSPWH